MLPVLAGGAVSDQIGRDGPCLGHLVRFQEGHRQVVSEGHLVGHLEPGAEGQVRARDLRVDLGIGELGGDLEGPAVVPHRRLRVPLLLLEQTEVEVAPALALEDVEAAFVGGARLAQILGIRNPKSAIRNGSRAGPAPWRVCLP